MAGRQGASHPAPLQAQSWLAFWNGVLLLTCRSCGAAGGMHVTSHRWGFSRSGRCHLPPLTHCAHMPPSAADCSPAHLEGQLVAILRAYLDLQHLAVRHCALLSARCTSLAEAANCNTRPPAGGGGSGRRQLWPRGEGPAVGGQIGNAAAPGRVAGPAVAVERTGQLLTA